MYGLFDIRGNFGDIRHIFTFSDLLFAFSKSSKPLFNPSSEEPQPPGQPLAEDHGTRCTFGARGPGTKVAGTDASDYTRFAISCYLISADFQLTMSTYLCPQ